MEEEGVFMESGLWVELWQMSNSQIMEGLDYQVDILGDWELSSFHSNSFPPSCNQMKSFPSFSSSYKFLFSLLSASTLV